MPSRYSVGRQRTLWCKAGLALSAKQEEQYGRDLRPWFDALSPLAGQDKDMAGILRRTLRDPGLPEPYRSPAGWPAAMREEYGDDEGTSAAARHREALVTQMRKARRLLDDFAPDFVVIWGDDPV